MKRASAILLVTILGACGTAPPVVRIDDAARAIQIDRVAAAPGMVELGVVSAQNGHGCGAGGKRGNYEDARDALKAEAQKLRATYVRLTAVEEPYLGFFCFHNAYVLTGTAYR